MERVERKSARRAGSTSSQSGFTLLELIVAVGMFTIIMGAIYMLLNAGKSDAFNTKERTATMQNARVALNTINRDAINAGVGYWKSGALAPDGTLTRLLFLPGETDGVADLLTPIVPGDSVRTIVVDGQNVQTDAVTFVYQDNSFNAGHAVAVSAVNSGTNLVTVASNAPCVNGSLYVYVIDDGSRRALGSLTALNGTTQIRFANGDPLRLNNPGGSSTFTGLGPSALKRITWVTYFVRPDNVLVRRVYGNTGAIVGEGVQNGGLGGVVPDDGGSGVGFVEMPLAYGVENFQVRYVLENGATVDNITAGTDASGNPLTAAQMRQRIRLVQVDINLRGEQNDPRSNQPVQVALSGAFYTPNLVVPEPPAGDAP